MKISSRTLGLSLLLVGAYFVTVFSIDPIRFWLNSPAARLQALWESDLELLGTAHKLPPQFANIREVALKPATATAKEWAKNLKIPIALNSQGQYRLEILLLSFEEEGTIGAIMQYDLVDLKSDNLVWEVGRTFILEFP
jgi:hypothetical protein